MKKLFSGLRSEKKDRGGRFEPSGYDPKTQYPAIRASICTGEKVAGFRDKRGGRFVEVMLIRSDKDLDEFERTYGVENITTEY